MGELVANKTFKEKFKDWWSQMNDGKEKFGSKEWFYAYGLVILGTFLYTAGDLMFAYPYRLAPGGVGGLSNVLNVLFPWKVSFYYYLMNIPLFIMGLIILGPKFGVKTLLSVLVSFVAIWVVETYWGYKPLIHVGDYLSDASSWPKNTALQIDHDGRWFIPDYMLNSVIAGIAYGFGIGLIFKAGATSGGSDIISMVIHKYTHISLGVMVMIVDTTIACTSLLINSDIRIPIYSMILIFIEGKIIDVICDSSANKTMLIITDETEKMKELILQKLGRGAIIMQGKGMYKGEEKSIIYTTVNKKQYLTVKYAMKKIDPKSFITIINGTETLGEGFDELPEKP